MNVQKLRAAFLRVKSERNIIQETWQWIERYISPFRGKFFKDENSEDSVTWRRPWVYDATAIMAAQNLSSSLHSRLTSAASRWFGLRFTDDSLNDDNEALEWLEECSNICFHALQESNFNVEINECYQDLVCFGTAVLIEESNDDDPEGKSLTFSAVPIKECYFEQDHNGDILNFYRQMNWTLLQIKDFFADQPMPEFITSAIEEEDADYSKRFDVVYCIYRRFDIPKGDGSGNISPEKRPWGWKYFLLDSAEPIGDEGGFYEMPAFVPRWRKTSASMWGNSPAMIALSDTMTLNRTIELNLSAVEKALDPPTLTTSRGLIGDLDLNAGGLTTVRDVSEIVPFQSGARFDVTYQEMNRLRDNIEKYFYIPQLILPPMEGTPATATEIAVRMQQLEALIGPTLGRLQVDLLDPVVRRTFYILYRQGELPEPPQSVLESESGTQIEYLSPMAKTMESSNVQAIERWVMTLAGLAEVNPELLDIPDWDEIAKQMAQKMGVSAKLIRNTDDIEADRQQRNEVQNEVAQGQAMQEMGKGMQEMNAVGGNDV